MKRSARTRQPLSCLFVDLDGFERVNDTEGPLAGDRVLSAVAEAIRERVRSTDSVARFGGDEFVVLLPDTSTLEAGLVADALLDPIADATQASVTASVGVAELQAGMTPTELLDRADASRRQRRTTDAGQSRSPV
jgi:diguanylate cyclase (GGDEF)-like protein